MTLAPQIVRTQDAGEELAYSFFRAGVSSSVFGNPAVEQLVAKTLLTETGSNTWMPNYGTGLTQILGPPLDATGMEIVQAKITQAVLQAEETVRLSQIGVALPPSEQLTRIDIRSVEYDVDTGAFAVRLALTMADGNVLRLLLS